MTAQEMQELIDKGHVCLNEVWLDNVKKLLKVAEASMMLCNALTPEERKSKALFPEYRDLSEALAELEAD